MGFKAARSNGRRSQGGIKHSRTALHPALLVLTVFLPQPASAAAIFPAVTTLITGGAVALAVAAGVWAIYNLQLAAQLRRLLRSASAKAAADIATRDRLIEASSESVVVLGGRTEETRSYSDGNALIESCLAGPDAIEVSQALRKLRERGEAFSLVARQREGCVVHMRGRAIGSLAAIWLQPESASGTGVPALSLAFESLPIPVWIRDQSLKLIWGNRAFLGAVGVADREMAISRQVALEPSERELAGVALTEGHAVEARRFAVVSGQRRTIALTATPLENGQILGLGLDVTAVTNAESKLQQHLDAHADTLDKLATAVAIFGRDQRLTFHNTAFAQLWNLPEEWLDRHPTDGEILDRLREGRRLPEQRDYQAWKRERLSAYAQSDSYLPEELWHLPGGKTLRVVAQPHPFGGLTYLYEDVTEKIALESSYNTLIKVQRATLDTLGEGVAVFGPDGRLKLFNAAFARLWQFEESELAAEPHVRRIAEGCIRRFGEETAWDKLVASISSGADRRRDCGEIERLDRTIVAVSLAPLPDGATLVTFDDVTDRFRIESALRERNEALEAADRLKSDFVHHASFLFRDPLNAVQGFADLLAAGHAGSLSPKQAEYVQNILTASGKLAAITSDILDLAMIDSGNMQLELERVELFDVLSRVAEQLRQHGESLDIAFVLDVVPDIGTVVLDQRRARQIVFNLLSNAFKYTPRGGRIVLGAKLAGDDLQIWVADSGPGIAADVKARAFDQFSAKGHAGRRAGAGLGLALVNRFVELHSGWVEIESGEQGTLVRCHFPRRSHQLAMTRAGAA